MCKFTQKDKNINLRCVEGISEKLRCIVRYQKIRFNFYTESTLRKLLSKRKIGWLQNIKAMPIMKLTVVTTKAVYFGEYKLSLNRD